MTYKILVERVEFTLFAEVEYEKLPNFCTHCKVIGHQYNSYRRRIGLIAAKGIPKVDKVQQNKVNEDVILEAGHIHVEVENVGRTSGVTTPFPFIFNHKVVISLVEPVIEPQYQNSNVGKSTGPSLFRILVLPVQTMF